MSERCVRCGRPVEFPEFEIDGAAIHRTCFTGQDAWHVKRRSPEVKRLRAEVERLKAIIEGGAAMADGLECGAVADFLCRAMANPATPLQEL